MAVTNGWGQARVNNTIGFGQGSDNNNISWGSIYEDSWSGESSIQGLSKEAMQFQYRVISDGGVVESLYCVSQSIK
tara:strand:+ start:979 stop:1206 length:228 start_codon:yes stop_codon:yes gene_type:complete